MADQLNQDIKKQHRQYKNAAPRWQLISDCLVGEDKIKERKEAYLPYPVAIPDEIRKDPKFERKYSVYLAGASFTNFVEQTQEDLVAGCFKREVIKGENYPELIDYIDIDDAARECVSLVSSYGRALILADYPTTPQDRVLTKAEEDALSLQAFITIYHPTCVINWSSKSKGGKEILTRVVIIEQEDDGESLKTNYRELYLDVNGIYTIKLHKELSGSGVDSSQPVIQPKINGKVMDFIPAVFVGSMNNKSIVDKIPLLGIARTNIKHYQTMAELFYVQTMVGHPNLVVTGVESGATQDDAGNKIKVNIEVGTTDALLFEGGETDAKFLQIDAGNLIHFKMLEQLEKSMLEQGARIKAFGMKAGVESAEALRTRNSGSISTLAKIAVNCERAIVDVLGWCLLFMGGSEQEQADIAIDINKEFYDLTADPATITSLNAVVAGGQTPRYVLTGYLRKTGLLDESKTDEEVDADIEDSNATSAGMPRNNFGGNNNQQ
jgi:hypothetical protein